jgi:hypothetical protein
MGLAPCRGCDLRINTQAIRCPRCGALNPTEGSPTTIRRWIGVAVAFGALLCIGGGLLILFNVFETYTKTAVSSDVPLCNSVAVIDQAKRAIEGAPVAKMMHVRVLDIRESQEVQYDAGGKRRWCSALAILDSGQQPINYTAEWTDDRPRQVWVQVDYGK